MATRGLLFELQVCNSKVNKNTIFSVSFFFSSKRQFRNQTIRTLNRCCTKALYEHTYTLYSLSLLSFLLSLTLFSKAWEGQRVPSLGLGLGNLWAKGTP